MKILVPLAGVLLLFASGCIRDIEESFNKISDVKQVEWDPTIAAPIVKTRLTIEDFLNQTSTAFLEIDDDNLIHVVYRGELGSIKASQLAGIPPQNFNGSFGLTQFHINELNNNGSVTINASTIFNFDLTSAEMDSLYMKACALATQLSSDLQHDLSIKLTIPGIQLNGADYTHTFDLPYSGSTPSTVSASDNVSGAFFDLTKSGVQNFNQLRAFFDITVNKVGNNPISTSDMVSFNTNMLYNEYTVMYGFITGSDISPNTGDSIEFDLFKGVDSSLRDIDFSIGDPRVKVIIENSYGIPINASITDFAVVTTDGDRIVATGYPAPLPIPTPTRQQIGETVRDSFELNKNNSNIADLVSNVPRRLIYDYDAQVNPPGTTERNFVTYNSELKVIVDIDVPLDGSGNGFVLNRELPLDSSFQDFEDVEELDEVNLRLYIENDFPVDVDLQIYFKDQDSVIVDSLFVPSQLLLRSPAVDANGIITGPEKYTIDITMDKARFEKIRDAKTGLVTAKLNTTRSGNTYPNVKFLSNYGITVKLGLQARAVVKLQTQ